MRHFLVPLGTLFVFSLNCEKAISGTSVRLCLKTLNKVISNGEHRSLENVGIVITKEFEQKSKYLLGRAFDPLIFFKVLISDNPRKVRDPLYGHLKIPPGINGDLITIEIEFLNQIYVIEYGLMLFNGKEIFTATKINRQHRTSLTFEEIKILATIDNVKPFETPKNKKINNLSTENEQWNVAKEVKDSFKLRSGWDSVLMTNDLDFRGPTFSRVNSLGESEYIVFVKTDYKEAAILKSDFNIREFFIVGTKNIDGLFDVKKIVSSNSSKEFSDLKKLYLERVMEFLNFKESLKLPFVFGDESYSLTVSPGQLALKYLMHQVGPKDLTDSLSRIIGARNLYYTNRSGQRDISPKLIEFLLIASDSSIWSLVVERDVENKSNFVFRSAYKTEKKDIENQFLFRRGLEGNDLDPILFLDLKKLDARLQGVYRRD